MATKKSVKEKSAKKPQPVKKPSLAHSDGRRELAASIYIASFASGKPQTFSASIRQAGFPQISANRAKEIILECQVYKDWIAKKVGNISKIYVVDKLKNIADANIADIFKYSKGGYLSVNNLSELPRELTGCIESIKYNPKHDSISIKLYNKLSALDILSKINGYYAPVITDLTGDINFTFGKDNADRP